MPISDNQQPTNSTDKLPPQAGQEIGQSGTYFYKGYITAEEYSIDLQGKYGLQVYDVMRKSDATIHAILQVCKQPILSADWKIDAASDDDIDQEIAKRANYEIFNRQISYHSVMREGLTFLDFGFFIAENVFEAAEFDGKPYIGIKKIASRKQRSILKFQMDDDKPGITQILPNAAKTANIPREKLLYAINDQEGENYYGTSLLRYAYKPWKIKDGLEIMNAVALENQALGVPYIKKGVNGETVDEGELIKLRSLLRNQRLNEEAYWEYPASVEVGFTDMKGHTTKEILPTIAYQDQQITLSVLAQFLLLGANDASGSRAVSQDHSRLFVKALVSVAKTWQEAFQRDVLNKWVDLNYSKLPNGYPKLAFSTISDEDVQETANAVTALMGAGAITPDRDLENRLRSMMNVPLLSKDDYENYDEKHKPVDVKAAEDNADNPDDPTGKQPNGDKSNPDDPGKQKQDLPDEKNKDDKAQLSVEEIIKQARALHSSAMDTLARP